MKNITIFFCIVVLLAVGGCAKDANTEHVAITSGASTKFSEEEVVNAISYVKDNFDFKDCILTKLVYDEEKSNRVVDSYMKNGAGMTNGVKEENTITIMSDFEVGAKADSSLSKNSLHTDYNWLLIRDSKDGSWKLDDRGY